MSSGTNAASVGIRPPADPAPARREGTHLDAVHALVDELLRCRRGRWLLPSFHQNFCAMKFQLLTTGTTTVPSTRRVACPKRLTSVKRTKGTS